MTRNDYDDTHECRFNTAGYCPGCGARVAVPPPPKVTNMGSPVGPGFVVYERAPGQYGYDAKMACDSVGRGWRHLVQVLFDRINHDKRLNPTSGFANTVVTQVKEKFGLLRIYFFINAEPFEPSGRPVPARVTVYEGALDQVEGFIDALAAVSGRTCEACGSLGRTRDSGWMLTLCDPCSLKDHRALYEKTEQQDEP